MPRRRAALRARLLVVVALLLVLLTIYAMRATAPPIETPTPTSAPRAVPASPTSVPSPCAGRDPKANVYQPDRLVLQHPCFVVVGTVVSVKAEADGDFHIQLRLDQGQEFFLNAKNVSDQRGTLVLEIVCANPVTQTNAVETCAADRDERLTPPANGQHIEAVGAFVLDTVHGWMEIHPVYVWRVVHP